MEIKVYGRLTDIVGSNGLNPEEVEDTDQLKKKLVFLCPDLSDVDYAIAVNNQIVRGNHPLHKNDVISLLPPFSGG